jgi:hypothetical protein
MRFAVLDASRWEPGGSIEPELLKEIVGAD